MTKKTAATFGAFAAALVGAFAAAEEPRVPVAATTASETARNAATLPNPGDDWILRAATGGDVGEENALSTLERVAAVGKILAVDSTGIETEDRRLERRERTPKRPGDALLFWPPVDPSAAEAFCSEIRKASGARNRDRFWLRNGDEFDGELLKIDRRRVWIRAFGVEFAVPRGRVRAVRFAAKDENREVGE